MANSLGIDLVGKVILMHGDCPESERTVKVEDGLDAGFGARPQLSGSALFVRMWDGHKATGQSFRVNGNEVERVVE